MEPFIPEWALRTVTPEDYGLTQDAYSLGRTRVKRLDLKVLQAWAKKQGWRVPSFDFQKVFIAKMLESEENFELALNESGIELLIPKKEFTLTLETLKKFDELYETSIDMGILGRRATRWDDLVLELRDVRRAVEAGVLVKIEGTQTVLNTWGSFYDWAHGRYHALEDGADKWIGDDS